ncbi:hypothetical protein O6H91_12G091200 [Diphasiastrum complanatum]|uniref:Uncharacterized protein n=1 Tax=Diphasiastrum complanatum TaxID=34168 RepID=A0ACC2C4N8_DIPCM|nr:hypothetical protein O6H91_12G091200 [Diphasiastrum complanatum]
MDCGVPEARSSVADLGFFYESNDRQKNAGGNTNKHKSSSVCPAATHSAEVVEVVFDATKEITKHALEWTLNHLIVQSGDFINLLAVVPNMNKDIFSTLVKSRECMQAKSWTESKEKIISSCRQLLEEVQKTCDEKKVHTRVKVIRAEIRGFAAAEAAKRKATWVVLDRHFEKEGKLCVEKLQCNVVVVNYFHVYILRLNLKRSTKRVKKDSCLEDSSSCAARAREGKYGTIDRIQMRSPEIGIKYTSAELGIDLPTSVVEDFLSASGLDAGTDACPLSTNIGLNFTEDVLQTGERNRATSCFKDGSGPSTLDKDSEKATFIENQETILRNTLLKSKDALFTLERKPMPNKYASKAFRKRSSIDLGKSLHVLKTEIVRRVSKYGKQMRRPETGTSAELVTELIRSLASDCFSACGLKMRTDAGLPSTDIRLNFMEEDHQSGEISQRNRAICCSKDGSGTSNFDNDSKKAASIEDQETSRNLLSNTRHAIFTLERELLPNRYASKVPQSGEFSERNRATYCFTDGSGSSDFDNDSKKATSIENQETSLRNLLLNSGFTLERELLPSIYASKGEQLLRTTCLPPHNSKSSRRYRVSEFKLQSKESKTPLSTSITSAILRPAKIRAPSDLLALVNNKREDAPEKRFLIEVSHERDLEAQPDLEQERQGQEKLDWSPNLRFAMLLSHHTPPDPPPLCSICQHKSPQFDRSARRFSYIELQSATNGFSKENLITDKGNGSVHQGALPGGQMVAVKQCTLTGCEGDKEFCSETEILSSAHHRNVVPLIGYCIEDHARFMVYEFVCNGSLESHLYGRNKPLLEWRSRTRISIGAARGLRYLHEESRVGCIIHQDMRPNNILLTHDFEPMVGGFELARWQPDKGFGVETKIQKSFGYLSPEYSLNGQIAVKTDVFSFGVVLLEIATGKKAIDFARPKGQQCLTEWARPLLEAQSYDELADTQLVNRYNNYEMQRMLYTAYVCISPDPLLRPSMSQVVRMLEGNVLHDRDLSA